MIANTWSGTTALFKALAFMKQHPRVLLYCITPIFISLVVYGMIVLTLSGGAVWLVSGLVDWSSAWYVVTIRVVLQIIAIIAVVVVSTMLFSLLANLIASPFNEQLSQYVERTVLAARGSSSTAVEEQFSWRQFGIDSIRSLKEESVKLVIFGIPQLLLLLLHLIPGVGSTIYLIVMVPISGYTLAYEYLDLPLSRYYSGQYPERSLTVGLKLRYIYQHAASAMPFGWICTLLLAIPLLNIFVMPVCVIAGTLLYCHHAAAKSDRY